MTIAIGVPSKMMIPMTNLSGSLMAPGGMIHSLRVPAGGVPPRSDVCSAVITVHRAGGAKLPKAISGAVQIPSPGSGQTKGVVIEIFSGNAGMPQPLNIPRTAEIPNLESTLRRMSDTTEVSGGEAHHLSQVGEESLVVLESPCYEACHRQDTEGVTLVIDPGALKGNGVNEEVCHHVRVVRTADHGSARGHRQMHQGASLSAGRATSLERDAARDRGTVVHHHVPAEKMIA